MTATAQAPPRPRDYAEAVIGAPCWTERGGLRLRYAPFKPTRQQASFLALTSLEALLGGSGGGGKSLTLLLAALQFSDVPGYNALVIRRTLTDLKLPDSLIPMSKWLLEGRGPTWNANEHKWTFPSGAVLQFGYLASPGDEYRYQSTQFQFIGVDEITQLPYEDPFTYLFSRLRRAKLDRTAMLAKHGVSPDGLTVADIPLRVRAATNPAPNWVKARYVDPATAVAPFISTSFVDNPGIDNDEYRRSLSHLGEVERRRLELGDWDAVEVPGALWRFSDIEHVDDLPEFDTVVLGVDPAISEGTGDECGIVAGGIANGIVTVLDDASIRAHPDEWAKAAVECYHRNGASRLVMESNQGGEMNRSIVNNAADVLGLARPNILLVRANAGENKERRAQPVAQAYRANKVVHLRRLAGTGVEQQMAGWVPGDKRSIKSPDRVDALVWMVNHILFGAGGSQPRSNAKEKLSTWSRSSDSIRGF